MGQALKIHFIDKFFTFKVNLKSVTTLHSQLILQYKGMVLTYRQNKSRAKGSDENKLLKLTPSMT